MADNTESSFRVAGAATTTTCSVAIAASTCLEAAITDVMRLFLFAATTATFYAGVNSFSSNASAPVVIVVVVITLRAEAPTIKTEVIMTFCTSAADDANAAVVVITFTVNTATTSATKVKFKTLIGRNKR